MSFRCHPTQRSTRLTSAQKLIEMHMPCGLSAAYMGLIASLIVQSLLLSHISPMEGPYHLPHSPVHYELQQHWASQRRKKLQLALKSAFPTEMKKR